MEDMNCKNIKGMVGARYCAGNLAFLKNCLQAMLACLRLFPCLSKSDFRLLRNGQNSNIPRHNISRTLAGG